MDAVNTPTYPSSAPVPEYAGFLVRFVAYLIDCVIIGFVIAILMIPAMGLMFGAGVMASSSNRSGSGLAVISMLLMLVIFLIALVVVVVYYAWFESSKYMGTPGKMVMKLKVTDVNGNRISFVTALLRFIVKSVLNQIFWVGSLFILFNDKKQGLYDMLLGTYVLRKE